MADIRTLSDKWLSQLQSGKHRTQPGELAARMMSTTPADAQALQASQTRAILEGQAAQAAAGGGGFMAPLRAIADTYMTLGDPAGLVAGSVPDAVSYSWQDLDSPDPLTKAMAAQQLMGGGGGNALKPNAKNLQQFLGLMRDRIQKQYANYNNPMFSSIGIWDPDVVKQISLADAYSAARYPRRNKAPTTTGKPPKTDGTLDIQELPPSAWASGKYDPIYDEILVKEPRTNTIHKEPYGTRMRQLVETINHERQHQLDMVRQASPIPVEAFFPPGVKALARHRKGMEKGKFINGEGTYKLPSGPDASAQDRFDYRTQPVEARAFQAGETAGKGFNDFLNLLARGGMIQPPPYRNLPIRGDFIDTAFMDDSYSRLLEDSLRKLVLPAKPK